MSDVLSAFGPATRAWFGSAFAGPTPAQEGAWRAISAGHHALVVAPTGSGKTLAAFLWAIDQLAHRQALAGRPPSGPADGQALTGRPPSRPTAEPNAGRTRVLYLSPIKALAVDVERNLRAPLTGIRHAADRLGLPRPEITVGMRTGDTPADERRAFTRRPPDILITTPESLFLLLTSQAREALRDVETVIVDEVHAVAGSKRGAHLALSLERLDALLPKPAQRIGLSATVRPVETVAAFLGGAAPVEIVRPPSTKTIEVAVQVPLADMTALDEVRPDDEGPRRASIWPAVEERVLDLIQAHRSTIVFANSRRGAERLCARLNELAEERADGGDRGSASPGMPAQIMAQAGRAEGAPGVVARAHHGSVSKEERKQIEEALKTGRLPAVVATSSLELGIDMGAVDLVIQVQAPPSVAAGLQRVGRAGHQVGAVSKGVVFPLHRGDLLSCAVVGRRMTDGLIEAVSPPRNPLDVLAQQIVAMVAMDSWSVPELAALCRRSAPFAELPDSAFWAVLDMLAGRYPSTAFAELRPRLIWDRAADTLTARPGAQRLAVTSGGTIPDRGLFGVFLAGAAKPSRVGELDEEMVYESRVGDVFALGSSSWRIEEITPDRVLVSPAPGQAARLPFWKGDAAGRPVELGRALGSFLRKGGDTGQLDEFAVANLKSYLDDQRAAIRQLPDDRTIVVERFRDELGDWRIAIHCLLGAPVNAPWGLAIGRRLTERYGFDAQVLPSDDGIVIRLPDTADEPPATEIVLFEPDEIETLVRETVGTSALFAARFRECAARSLLLPRRDPGKRQPLWQQRQRSAQLLDVARDYADFPVTLEAARECLSDVFDLPALTELMTDLRSRKIRLVESETPKPSPFARSLLFGYVGAFLYEGDAPLAERRAAALALDPTLLGELLGRVELAELIDPAVIAATEASLRWLTEERRLRDGEDVIEVLRRIGDLSLDELAVRGAQEEWLVELQASRRVVALGIAGEQRYVVAEDAGRYSAALGSPLPPGLAEAVLTAGADPLGDLVGRFSRTHAIFTTDTCAGRFGLGTAVVSHVLRGLAARGRLVRVDTAEGAGERWCDPEVLRLLRRRSLAALRREIEPVAPAALGRFLARWQRLGRRSAAGGQGEGVDAVAAAIDQLTGVAIPASAWERLVLPARISDYRPSYLDELCATGEVLWAGSGHIGGGDGWVTLAFADTAPLLLPPPLPIAEDSTEARVLDALGDGQALFFRQLLDRTGLPGEETLAALWELVWSGLVSNDTLAPLRSALAGTGAHKARSGPARARVRRPSLAALARAAAPPTSAGRWYALPARDLDPTRRGAAIADAMLERYGVVTRGVAAGLPGGFAGVYPVLAALEDRGAVRRGYFVDGLGAAQFALPGAVDRLRALAEPTGRDPAVLVLAATDPANPYGAALPWPPTEEGHRPGRRAGALVVLHDGELGLYVERGGKTILSYLEEEEKLVAAASALAAAARDGWLDGLRVERADGESVLDSPLAGALHQAGFRLTPRGLTLRP